MTELLLLILVIINALQLGMNIASWTQNSYSYKRFQKWLHKVRGLD